MIRRLVLVSIATTLALAVFAPIANATFIPGPNGKIVFTSGRANSEVALPADKDDSKAKLWIVDYPFGTPVQVTTLPAGTQHRHPSWSPDHTKIVYAAGPAFVGPFALWIVDLKTGAQTEFAPAAAMQDRPSWSPDGTEIAYGSNGELWVKGVAPGSVAEKLTNTAGITEERPVWSPDGNTLYYNRGPAGNRDIYSKSPLTLGGAELPIVTEPLDNWQPALSPDGKRLCYLRGPQDDGAKLRTVNVNGTGDAAFTGDGVTGALNCVWSPDGTRILYTGGAYHNGQLRSRDINGGDLDIHAGYNVAEHFDGNADWATNFSPECEPRSADIGVNQFTTITLSCTDPDSGFGKAPPTADPLGDSSLEIVTGPKNGAIGGIDNTKVVYSPNKDFKGTDTFTYTGDDETSEAPPATVTIRVGLQAADGGDTTGPVVSSIKVSKKRWRLGKGLASISLLPVGTAIAFNLSEAAQANVSFQRGRPGKRVGKSCAKPTPANSKGKACTRFVGAGSLAPLAAKAGGNSVRFQGRLSRTRSLAPGRYRVRVGARDAAGNSTPPRTGPNFTIVNE